MPKEYIEREALIQKIVNTPFVVYLTGETDNYKEGCLHGLVAKQNNVIDMINNQPTADVVEVCKCEKCQFGEYDDKQKMILCKRILNITDGEHFVYNNLNDFCSYGVRKDK